ncbi:hypothetical protein NE236_41685 [Actinoallomurus purpureus]|uniref:hypothetical protein n=1 Tax=Actinoallomurus purpureus TaxID=478114 RepID=UPI0020937030|nr:hypothetical protein [Actinoallomurus purpureus]MCO6011482.1 hypothetical protein [Actinoallomurus purpureus]
MNEYFVVLTVQNNEGRRTYAGPLTGATRRDLFFQAFEALGIGPDYTVVFFSVEPNQLGGAS